MTQVEISWELCSIEATVSRIKEITNAERDLLLGLVRVYYRARQLGNGYHDNGDGRVLVEPSKRELAKAIGVGLATVKRRLRDLRDLPGGSRYISVGESSWRTHCYEINFSAIYSADLIENDPGSGGSNRGLTRGIRGITRTDQGDQGAHALGSSPRLRFQGSTEPIRGITGGAQGAQNSHHTIDPNHKDHLQKPNNQKTISGAGGSLKRFGFIDLRKSEFRDPVAIEKRFREVVEAQVLKDCEADRISFFALMINLGRSKGLDNPAGLLTVLIRGGLDPYKKNWRTRPANRDDEKAREWIRKLDREQREAESAHTADDDSLDEWGDDWVDGTPIDDDAAAQDPEPAKPANDLPVEVVNQLPDDVADQIRQFQERKRRELAGR